MISSTIQFILKLLLFKHTVIIIFFNILIDTNLYFIDIKLGDQLTKAVTVFRKINQYIK